MSEKSKALFLFPGGKDGVLRRMTSNVSRVLSKKGPKFCSLFAEEFGLGKDRIKRLKKGEEPLDFKFFEVVKGALGISLHEVLGQPKFKDDAQKEYWSKQREVMPMALSAPAKEPSARKRRTIDDAELRFYLRRRAVHELVWDA